MTKIVYSSDQLPLRLNNQDRFKQWRDFHAAHLGEVEMVRSPGTPFYGHCELRPLGDVTVIQSHFAIERFVRRSQHIPSDARDSCTIGFISTETRSRIEQRGREIEIAKGQPFISQIDAPYSCGFDSPYSALSIVVPRKLLRERIPGLSLDGAAAMATSPVWQHLERYLSVLMDADFPGAPALGTQAENYVVDLLALALGARGDSAELATARGLRAIRLREIVGEIERRYADPAFSSDDVARAVGLSRRYVNELLYESGASFSERLLELRLKKAHAMLADPRYDRLRISDIAFTSGFNEVSYFNRRFRARFGYSPTHRRGGGSEQPD